MMTAEDARWRLVGDDSRRRRLWRAGEVGGGDEDEDEEELRDCIRAESCVLVFVCLCVRERIAIGNRMRMESVKFNIVYMLLLSKEGNCCVSS